MNIREKVHIKVLNYSTVKVCVESRNRGYVFEPARNNIPTFEVMGFEDIDYINSRSAVFRNGGLRFEKEDENEIFNALKHPKWKDEIITEEVIEDMIFHPSVKNQERVIAIKDMATIERLRGKLVFYLNEGTEGISTKNAELIKNRFKELCANKINSEIIVKEAKQKEYYENPELDSVKEQNKILQDQINEMKAMLERYVKEQSSEDDKEVVAEKKPTGKPKKASTKEE